MSQNDPKPAETTKKILRNDPKFQNWGNLEAQMPKSRHFGPKIINFLILTKFRMYPILKVLISNLTFVFESFEPKSPNLGTLGQKVLTFKS